MQMGMTNRRSSRLLKKCCLLIFGLGSVPALAQGPFPFQDPRLAPEDRISDLIERMTLEEKIDALSTNPTVPRLGVIGTGHVEGLHGLALGGPGGWEGKNQTVIPTTQFPQARGLGQTWDPQLIEKAAALEAFETNYAFGKYHRGGRVVRAPNADLSRDPRWGRSEESYGEDPLLVGTMATAFTRGLQGSDSHYWATASLLKHFLANSNEDLRDSSSSNFDERLFREYYSVPFRMAIQQGHANAMMTAYNAWNGTPMEVNPVLRAVVMKQWGFDGILCTDGGALTNLVKHHHAFPDLPHAAAASIHAGINQFLDDFREPVREAVKQKLVSEDEIAQDIRGVFRVMLRLGMLDAPSTTPYDTIGENAPIGGDPWWSAESRALVRKVSYSDGKDLTAAAEVARSSSVAIVIVGNHPTCDAGWFKCALPSEGKEAIDRKSLALEQEDLVKAVLTANPHTVVVLQTSFPYTTTWTQEHAPAILQITHNSQEQGNGLADVLFGDYNPAGRLTQTWVSSFEQLPPMMDYDLRHGRTYLYLKDKPLYPFGYGLSYTTFRYDHLQVNPQRLGGDEELTATFDLTNSGSREGDEVVQMCVAHVGSKIDRPQQQLKAFQRIHLKAREKRQVELHLHASDLAYWDTTAQRWTLEGDEIELRIGASSADIQLRKTITVTGSTAHAETKASSSPADLIRSENN
jgi:beta-glucosidase